MRPEKDSGGSAHSSWKEAGISRPKGKVFPQYGGEHPALPIKEHPVREQSSPCDSLLLKPACVHMEYVLLVELLKKL